MRPYAAAVLATALAVGCSEGYSRVTTAPRASAQPTATPVVDPALGVSEETAEPEPAPPPPPDVDGDGRPDVVTTVTSGDQNGTDWRWGLRVAMTSRGTQTVWNECCPDGQQYEVVGDVDGDRDVELAGLYGTTATASGWFLVTVHGGRLTVVDGPELSRGLAEGGETTWSCVPEGIVVASAVFQGTTGTRTYYRLDGARLVRTRQMRDRWGNGVARPPEYASVAGCSGS